MLTEKDQQQFWQDIQKSIHQNRCYSVWQYHDSLEEYECAVRNASLYLDAEQEYIACAVLQKLDSLELVRLYLPMDTEQMEQLLQQQGITQTYTICHIESNIDMIENYVWTYHTQDSLQEWNVLFSCLNDMDDVTLDVYEKALLLHPPATAKDIASSMVFGRTDAPVGNI